MEKIKIMFFNNYFILFFDLYLQNNIKQRYFDFIVFSLGKAFMNFYIFYKISYVCPFLTSPFNYLN